MNSVQSSYRKSTKPPKLASAPLSETRNTDSCQVYPGRTLTLYRLPLHVEFEFDAVRIVRRRPDLLDAAWMDSRVVDARIAFAACR